MADGDLPGCDGCTALENGLQRDMSIDKELQDKIFKELETLNTEGPKINDLEKGLHVRFIATRPLVLYLYTCIGA